MKIADDVDDDENWTGGFYELCLVFGAADDDNLDRAVRVLWRELRSTVRVDGFLAPIGDRRANTYKSGMYAGKRHRCGFNVQVVASWRGRLVMTGARMPGAMHNARAWSESGLAQRFAGRLHADGGPGGFADTGYTGTGLLVPERRTGPEPLGVHARDFNKLIASQRACVERFIAHMKNWRILACGYRRLTVNFPATLAAITNLEVYRISAHVSGMNYSLRRRGKPRCRRRATNRAIRASLAWRPSARQTRVPRSQSCRG